MSAPSLSPERIVNEAIALLDEEGPDSLSMRRLAARLGVSTMSTYHHFGDKAALVDAVAERVMSGLAQPPADADWTDALREMSRSFRDLTRVHPAVFRVLLAGERPAALVRTADAVVARLLGVGFSVEDATIVFRTFVRFLLGVVVVEADQRLDRDELDATFDAGLDLLIAGASAKAPVPAD